LQDAVYEIAPNASVIILFQKAPQNRDRGHFE
jgi:hypothetical protein